VRDGFAEVNPSGLTVIVEYAIAAEELTAETIASEIAAAEEKLAAAKDGPAKDRAGERVAQLKQVAAQLSGAAAH
jgi:F-type H+-transporting ATPase subunit epsilon